MVWFAGAIGSILIAFILFIVTITQSAHLKRNNSGDEVDSRIIFDPLILEKNMGGNTNRLFENHLDSRRIVDKYFLCREDEKVFMFAHLAASPASTDIMEIRAYSANGIFLQTFRLEFSNPVSARTFTFPLPKRTEFVNVFFRKGNDPVVFERDISEVTRPGYLALAQTESIALFFLLIPIGYFTLKLISGDQFTGFMNYRTALLGLGFMVIFSLVNFFILVFRIQKKSRSGR